MGNMSKKRDRKEKRLLANPFVYCLAIISFLLFFYYREIILQKKFLWDDCLNYWYPVFTFVKECLQRLRLPFWNPYIFAGMPFLNDVQSHVFYPIYWFFFFTNGPAPLTYFQVELICLFHLLLLGLSTFLLLSELKLNWPIAIFGSILLVFSGFVSLRINQLNVLTALAWHPLLIYFFIRLLNREGFRDSILAGFILSLALLGGHPQFTLQLIYALLIYYLGYIFFFQKPLTAPRLLASLIKVALFLFIGFGMALIHYYPSLKYVAYTARKEISFAEITDGSLSPIQLLTTLLPKFFGSASATETDGLFFWLAPNNYYYWESGIYLGILPLALALFAIFFSARRERYIFLVLTVLSLLLALGKYLPLYRLIWQIIPGFKQFRIPGRFLGIYTFSMTILAAFGLESVISFSEKVKRHLIRVSQTLTIILIISLLIYLLFLTKVLRNLNPFFRYPAIYRNSQKQFGIFLFYLFLTWFFFICRIRIKTKVSFFILFAGLVTFLDLYQFGNKFSQGETSASDFYPYSTLVRQLQEERKQEPFRINARKDGYMMLKRNEGCLWGLELLEGYTPLALADYVTFDIPPEKKFDLLNAKYKIKVDEEKRQMSLILNPTYLSRAKMFYQYLVIKDRKMQLAKLSSAEFDYPNCLLLEKKPPIKIGDTSWPVGTDTIIIPHQIIIERWDETEIKLMVNTEKPGLLFLSEIYYPEWRVRVNGKEKEIYRADYCLRAVPLDTGRHNLHFYYDTKNLKIGATFTCLTILFIAGLLVLDKRRKIC